MEEIKTISTGELCSRLGVVIPAKFLMELGVIPMQVTKLGIYWDENDYLLVCEALAKYFENGGALYG